MKRVIKFECGTLDDINNKKFVLAQEYEGFGIYEEVNPYGYRVNQSWLIANDKVALICQSYNYFCKEELLDMIDNYNEEQKFCVKGFYKGVLNNLDIYIAHGGYKEII